MGKYDAVEEFMETNVARFPDTPNPKQDVYLNALRDCLSRLSVHDITELGLKTVVYVPGDTPAVLRHYPVTMESVILLTNSMRRWTRDARVGTIALLFAEALLPEKEFGEIAALVLDWGFEKEFPAAMGKVDPGD